VAEPGARDGAEPEPGDAPIVYAIPDTRRRRTAAFVYLAGSALGVALVPAGLPRGLLVMAGLCALLGAWHLAAAFPIRITDSDALAAANRETEFPVGHASAAVGFDGWRARPVWNVLVFSADDPPSKRGLVRVDAVNGDVIGSYVEDDPDSWDVPGRSHHAEG
jgi:hypothetical protein